MKHIAVIGAGLSGLTAACYLNDKAKVTVFDKHCKPSGRLATRSDGKFTFDHGAQFFKAKDPEFKHFLKPLIRNGVIQPWCGRFVEFNNNNILSKRYWDASNPHYVGVPNMNDIGQYLSKEIDLRTNSCIVKIEKTAFGWIGFDRFHNKLGEFDWVIIATPPEQALPLLPNDFKYYQQLKSIRMNACLSLMLGFKNPLPLGFDAALVSGSDISWISVNSSKPKRNTEYSLLIHSTNKWADLHLKNTKDKNIEQLVDKASHITQADLTIAVHKKIHTWKYANINKQSGESSFIDPIQRVCVCGDWCIKGIVEAAFKSGVDSAKKIEKYL